MRLHRCLDGTEAGDHDGVDNHVGRSRLPVVADWGVADWVPDWVIGEQPGVVAGRRGRWRHLHGRKAELPLRPVVVPVDRQVVSTASTSIAYLTAQPTHDPCVTTKIEQGEEVSCSSRVTSLTLGGILISWYYYGLPNTALHFSPGRAVTIAGQPARLASGPPDPTCTRIGGYRSVDATVQPAMANGSPSLLHMDACLTSPVQTAPVLAMLHSLTFTAPPTARSPIRFPSVAVDDPCQPLRNDLYYRQPAGSGALPWSSTVTAARWCEATPGAHGERFTRYQSTGDVSALTRALHAPLTATATHVACTAGPASFPVAVEIIDQHATLFRPTLPVDPCGAISGARRALGVTASRPLAVD